MSVGKRTFIIIMILVLILVGACDKDPSPNRLKERSSEESSNQEGGSEGAVSTEGSATLSYTYKIDVPPQRVNLVQVDIPLLISPSTEDSNKYLVDGFAITTAYTQQGASNGCFIQCDLPAKYAVRGTVIETPVDEAGNCFISLEIIQGFEDVKPYGDCPEVALNMYKCSLHKNDYADGRTYIFSADDPVLTPKDVDDGLTITAEISDVKIPPAIKDTCRWSE